MGAIGFADIAATVAAVLDRAAGASSVPLGTVEDALALDGEGRRMAREAIAGRRLKAD